MRPCGYLHHEWVPGFVGYRKRNGLIVAAQECSVCGHVRTAIGVKITQAAASSLPLKRDRTNEAPICVRCAASTGTELHHWAPVGIFGFDDAESWPKDYLCRECHTQWHARMCDWRS